MGNTQLPQFNGNNYDYWAIKMRTMFSSQGLWNLVEDGLEEPANEQAFNALKQTKKDLMKSNRNKDSKSLFYLYQEVHENIFPRISVAKKSKDAWDTLQTTYQGMKKVKTTKL